MPRSAAVERQSVRLRREGRYSVRGRAQGKTPDCGNHSGINPHRWRTSRLAGKVLIFTGQTGRSAENTLGDCTPHRSSGYHALHLQCANR